MDDFHERSTFCVGTHGKCRFGCIVVACILSASISFASILSASILSASYAQAAGINLEEPSSRNLIADLHGDSRNKLNVDASRVVGSDTVGSANGSLNSDSSAMKLFVSSGLKELVGHIPVSTASSFEAALSAEQLPDLFMSVDQEDVAKAVNNAFKVETFNKYLVQQLNAGMSQQSREYMLAWYESALGARVKQAEIDNSLLTEHARFDNYQVFLEHYPAETDRVAIIEKLDVTMKSTESAMDMMGSIQVAFNLSLTRFMPEEHRLSRKEILAMVEQSQDELQSHYKEKTKAVLLFTYQALNDEDLARFNQILATDAGQEFVVAINNGIKKGMFAASLDLGDGLGALLDTMPQNSGI